MNTDRAISMGFDDGHFNENRKTFSGTVVADDNDKFADDGDVDKFDKLQDIYHSSEQANSEYNFIRRFATTDNQDDEGTSIDYKRNASSESGDIDNILYTPELGSGSEIGASSSNISERDGSVFEEIDPNEIQKIL